VAAKRSDADGTHIWTSQAAPFANTLATPQFMQTYSALACMKHAAKSSGATNLIALRAFPMTCHWFQFTLLYAFTWDGNRQVVWLAFSVVGGTENKSSWLYFIEHLRNDFPHSKVYMGDTKRPCVHVKAVIQHQDLGLTNENLYWPLYKTKSLLHAYSGHNPSFVSHIMSESLAVSALVPPRPAELEPPSTWSRKKCTTTTVENDRGPSAVSQVTLILPVNILIRFSCGTITRTKESNTLYLNRNFFPNLTEDEELIMSDGGDST
jgi:hypothetical protein